MTYARTDMERKLKSKIFVRKPDDGEQNANMIIIPKGATPIDAEGNILKLTQEELMTPEERQDRALQERIKQLLKGNKMNSQEIVRHLSLAWSDDRMKRYLAALPFVEKLKEKNKVYFRIQGEADSQLSLF